MGLLSSARSGDYTVDTARSSVGFLTREATASPVRGSFDDIAGHVYIDGADPGQSTATVTVRAAGVSTGNEQRDQDLRGPDILDTVAFPHITFVSTSIVHTAESHFVVTGDVTVRSVTHALKVRLDYRGQSRDSFGHVTLRFEGSGVVSRTEFGLDAEGQGGPSVPDRVTLDFGISLVSS